MKKIIFIMIFFTLVAALPSFAALKDDVFSVSSEDLDPSDSLNRVAGEIDLGFSAPSQSYKSASQTSGGPRGLEKAALASQS